MSDTATQLRDNVRSTAADLEVLVAAVNGDAVDPHVLQAIFEDHGVMEDDGYTSDDGAYYILSTWPLEIVQHGRRAPGGEWETTHVVVVFSTGGPHVELDTSERAVVGYWGSDRDRAPVSGVVVDYFGSLTDC
jgi:hypothetical protein